MLSDRGNIHAGWSAGQGGSAICAGQGTNLVRKGVIWIGKGLVRARKDFDLIFSFN